MAKRSLHGAVLAITLLPCVVKTQANFELGKMWTFEDPPLAYLQREYGFRPSAEWLRRVMLSSLRFGNGCSASFVSSKGLILTNHHCVRDQIAAVQAEKDWVRDGYTAHFYEDEIPLEGLTVQQLVKTREVTEQVDAGSEADELSEELIASQREANRRKILDNARAENPELEPEIVSLFQGAVYELYQYRVYRDIRLVVAPHLQTSHFGGDPDNFTYPRFAIDFSFCRAYEDGKPADTSENYFRWSKGATEGELVFLIGNPGGTERLLTEAQLEYLRDAQLPRIEQLIDNRLEIMRSFAAKSPRMEKQLRTNILGFENAQKLYHGEQSALLNDAFMARKRVAETAFQAKVAKDADLQSHYGSLWLDLAEVAQAKTALESRSSFQATGGSLHLRRAIQLLRATEGGLDASAIASVLAIPGDMNPIQTTFFVDHLRRAQDWLPPEDPYLRSVLGGKSPVEAARKLAAESRIGQDDFVRRLAAKGAEAIETSKDAALQIARVLLPLVDQNAARIAELDRRESVLGTKMGHALFAAYGNEVSPDATFTLRISDGRIKGYHYNGTLAPYRTVFHGLFARNAEFDNKHPFDLPAIWLQRQGRLDMDTAIDFVCTVDSTGGNSGSPVINKDMQIVGLLFDGNIESMGNQYLYAEEVERSVCVHPAAIMQALTKIYEAERIADELWGR